MGKAPPPPLQVEVTSQVRLCNGIECLNPTNRGGNTVPLWYPQSNLNGPNCGYLGAKALNPGKRAASSLSIATRKSRMISGLAVTLSACSSITISRSTASLKSHSIGYLFVSRQCGSSQNAEGKYSRPLSCAGRSSGSSRLPRKYFIPASLPQVRYLSGS